MGGIYVRLQQVCDAIALCKSPAAGSFQTSGALFGGNGVAAPIPAIVRRGKLLAAPDPKFKVVEDLFLTDRLASRRSVLTGLSVAAIGGAAACARGVSGQTPGDVAGSGRRIRFYGSAVGGLIENLQSAFGKQNPEITFKNTLPSSDTAMPALITHVTDLAPNGGEPSITETLGFFETRGYHVSSIVLASGTFDVEHRSNGPVVFVHESNPLTELSIEQLDGIFGSERTGGLNGFEWTPSLGRDASGNIRTWGQLGLTGEWSDKEIQTYGHAPSGASRFFQLHVLGNSDKWNPNYREYVETGSKMIAPEDRETQSLGAIHMLADELAQNPYGIAWSIMSQAKGIGGIRPIAIAPRGGASAVMPSPETFRDRSYPFVRNIYIFFDRAPGSPMPDDVKSFLEFSLSDEGQKIVEDIGFYRLPEDFRQEQLQTLDD